MAHFIRFGNTYKIAPAEAFDVWEKLPAATYTVKYNDMADEYFLVKVGNYETPAKLYGDIDKNCDRIMGTFLDRPDSTGVLLGGEKGSGKTLLAKLLSKTALEQGIPTVLINEPFSGDSFNEFLQSINQPAVVLFDEFEKVYSYDLQENILTLLDGVYPTKKLFVLTVNDTYGVNNHMVNRPGRLYYRLTYTGLEPEFVREYCTDVLDNKDHVESVVRLSSLFEAFNFDMLKAVVEESNRYSEHPSEVIKILNTKPEATDGAPYDVVVTNRSGTVVMNTDTFNGNPMQGVNVRWGGGDSPRAYPGGRRGGRSDRAVGGSLDEPFGTAKTEGDKEMFKIYFGPGDFFGVDDDGSLVFKGASGYTLQMRKQAAVQYDYGLL